MSSKKAAIEVEVASSPEKFWKAFCDSAELFPRLFPDQYTSIQVIQGDGKSPGTVRLMKFAPGMPLTTFAKQKIEELDDAGRMMSYRIIDGEIMRFYRTFKVTVKVDCPGGCDGGGCGGSGGASGGAGSLVWYSVEYEKVNEEDPDPAEAILSAAAKCFRVLDEHLLKNF